MIVDRHSGRDAGIQSQGCETVGYRLYKIKHLCTIGKLPSMALDSGTPAGMTAF